MQSIIEPRRPWLAALMSAVLPGFGQLYNGAVNRAIWLYLGVVVLAGPAVALVALYLPRGLMLPALCLGLAASVALWVAAIVDAWRDARRRPDHVPPPWQTSGLYAAVMLACGLVALPALTGWVRAHLVESFRVPSASMAPAIEPGDVMFVDKRYNCPGCKHALRRGDIVVFTDPNDRTRYYVKRLAGLPGDRVQGADAPVVVPPGHVWLLGDNTAHSIDSRMFGMVPLPDVIGRARQVWFSRGDGRIRWERLGLSLD